MKVPSAASARTTATVVTAMAGIETLPVLATEHSR